MSILPAKSIARQTKGDLQVKDEVTAILSNIEEDVKLSMEKRETSCVTQIPTNFDIPGMDNARAQKYVYFHVLRNMVKAGYIPVIKFSGDKSESQRVFIHTKWLSKEDVEIENYMDRYIQARTLNKPTKTDKTQEEIAEPIRRRRRGPTVCK